MSLLDLNAFIPNKICRTQPHISIFFQPLELGDQLIAVHAQRKCKYKLPSFFADFFTEICMGDDATKRFFSYCQADFLQWEKVSPLIQVEFQFSWKTCVLGCSVSSRSQLKQQSCSFSFPSEEKSFVPECLFVCLTGCETRTTSGEKWYKMREQLV